MQTANKVNELEALINASTVYSIRGQEVTANAVLLFIQQARSKGLNDFNIAKLITVCISDAPFKLVQLINNTTTNYATTNYVQQSYRRA